MKKQSLITLVTALFAVLTLTVFYACSADEGAPEAAQPTTKADILRAKAKEFAKKYGVNMTLNEDKIDSLAQVLTVEQMEEDFADYAACYKGISITIAEAGKDKSSSIRPKLGIRRSKSLKETSAPLDTIYSGSYKFTEDVQNRYGKHLNMSGTASWRFGNKGSNYVDMDLESSDGYSGSGHSLNATYTGGGTFSFDAIGYITMRKRSYSYTVRFSVYHRYYSGTSVSIQF